MRTAKTIADLVIGTPSSIPILERLGIDYRYHGQQGLYEACRSAGVTTEELMKMIESKATRSSGAKMGRPTADRADPRARRGRRNDGGDSRPDDGLHDPR